MERKREGVQYTNMYKQSYRWIERSRERIGQMKRKEDFETESNKKE